MGQDAVDALLRFLDLYRAPSPRPIVWVGAGASAAAGYPTLSQIEAKLRSNVPRSDKTGLELVDAFVEEWGSAALEDVLETQLGAPLPFVRLHASIARLAGASLLAAVFTTNPDELIEDALKAAEVRYVPQTLEDNFRLQARAELTVLKLHGSRTDWAAFILSGESHRRFQATYPLLAAQLDNSLRTHPVLFVGCSMADPRILGWLRALPEAERRALHPARVFITTGDWESLPEPDRALLATANVKPILVGTHDDVAAVLAEAARLRAPLPVRDLVFTITPAGETWTTVGPTVEHAPHTAPSPLHDAAFLEQLARFRDFAALPIVPGTAEALAQAATVESLARAVAGRLTAALLSDAARADVLTRLNRGRARFAVRIPGKDDESDAALALPWELVLPEPGGDFPVHAGLLDVVREAVLAGAPELPEATGPLVLAVSIAAPEDTSRLAYEQEAYRLQRALEPLGHDVAFTDLGDVDDLVRVADAVTPGAIHFSGHGLPGKLVFENDLGLADRVSIDDLVARLNVKLGSPPGRFPRFFYLASCHGAAGSGDHSPECRADASPEERCAHEREKAVGRGPSAAATLHRSRFVQVLGYFGPISDPLSTRAEEAFYGAVAAGKTTLQAAAEARESMGEEIALGDVKGRYPFAWSQLALYHRGPDRALARPGTPGAAAASPRLVRDEVKVSGMPLLKHGFIGRRSTLHRIRRLLKDGQRLFVIQGLGGLGKTALATHLLATVLAPDTADQLILACGGLDPETMDVASTLWRQVEEHAERHAIAGWEAKAKQLREGQPETVVGFERAVAMLRAARPGVVVYADNLETLQEGPDGDDAAALGSWSTAGRPVWAALERLSAGGCVVVTTRYGWKGLSEKAWVRIDPMREADVLRMVETWPHLREMKKSVQARIAERVDGHPRTVEFLDGLVAKRLEEMEPGVQVGDEWKELVEPVLPATSAKVTENLLLEALWERLSEAARAHARAMSVLRRPAPRPVVDALGSGATTGELIRAGVVTQFKEQANGKEGVEWVDRWGMHSVVGAFARARAGEEETREAHRKAGAAFSEWVKLPGARWGEQFEGIAHLHAIREGDRAWPLVESAALQLRRVARYREAKMLLEGCEAAGTSGDSLARALVLLAQMKLRLGEQSEEARALLDRAFKVAESDETRFYCTHDLARLLGEQGEYLEAESLLRESIAWVKKARGTDHANYGFMSHTLGEVLQSQGKYGEAEDLFRQAVTIKEKALGANHPEYGSSLHALAQVLGLQGKHREAESLLRRSLAIDEMALGVSHPSYSASLHALADVLNEQGEYSKAEELLRQSLAIKQKALGIDHPEYGDTLHGLATVLDSQGKHTEAERLLRQSLAISERVFGLDHPNVYPTLTNLAATLAHQGRLGEAEPLLVRALHISERVHDKDHPDTAQILNILAQLQSALGKREAKDTAQRAVDSLMATLGPEHPTTKDVVPILRDIASGVSTDLGLSQAAAAMEAREFARAVDILTPLRARARAANVPALEASACGLLAQALALTGRRGEALAHASRALAIAEELKQEDAAQAFRDLLASLEPGREDSTESRIRIAIEQAQSGDSEAAVRDLEAFADEASTADAPGPEASARVALAQILAGTGQPFLAGIQLRAALAIAERFSDDGAAAQIRAMLQALDPTP